MELKTFYVDYFDNHHDLCHVWVEAYDRQSAEDAARSEYWDIEEIISIRKGRA